MAKKFGYETKGASSWNIGKFFASRHVCPDAGVLNSISVYLFNDSGSTQKIQLGIYNDVSGTIGKRLISTISVSIPAAFDNWRTIIIPAFLNLGSVYWLTVQLENSAAIVYIYYDAGDEDQQAYKEAWDFGTWPDDPVGLTYSANKISIYATYTPVPYSPYTWGIISKNQIDPERVEAAIARIIGEHNDDEQAHIGEGRSLDQHKLSDVIDHVVASIVADKIKDWEVIKLGGSFDRTDFHWFTFFESLDGFHKAVYGDGTVTLNTSYLEIASGAADPGWAMIVEDVGIYDLFSWDKKRRIRTRVLFSSITQHVVSIANGLAENLPAQKCVRFLITNGAVHGYVSDGSAATDLDLSFNLVAATAYNLEIRFFPAEKVEFYIDGVLKGTITTNIPAGTSDAGIMMYIRIGNWYGAGSKYIRLSYFDVWQET